MIGWRGRRSGRGSVSRSRVRRSGRGSVSRSRVRRSRNSRGCRITYMS